MENFQLCSCCCNRHFDLNVKLKLDDGRTSHAKTKTTLPIKLINLNQLTFDMM